MRLEIINYNVFIPQLYFTFVIIYIPGIYKGALQYI